MSQPLNELSLDNVTGTSDGEEFTSKGHVHFTLFVIARNLDAANDTLTVRLEQSPRGEEWAEIASLSEADFNGESASTSVHGAAEHLRASVTDFTDNSGGDLTVDAYVLASGNLGLAQRGTGV